MACTNLACRTTEGCLESFDNGNIGEILTIGPDGLPVWADSCPCTSVVDNGDGTFTAFDENGAQVATWTNGNFTVTDSSTIDLTKTGVNISAAAIISPDAENCLVDSNGLYVPCPMVASASGRTDDAPGQGNYPGSGSATPNVYQAQALIIPITNPSATRPMQVQITSTGSIFGHFSSTSPGGTYNENTLHVAGLAGGPFQGSLEQNSTNIDSPEFGHAITISRVITVPAGGTVMWEMRNSVQMYNGTLNSIGLSRIAWSWIGVVV